MEEYDEESVICRHFRLSTNRQFYVYIYVCVYVCSSSGNGARGRSGLMVVTADFFRLYVVSLCLSSLPPFH